MMTLALSQFGLEKVDERRIKKGWNKDAKIWCDIAYVAESTLKRFWRKEKIKDENFRNICYAVGFTDDIIEGELIDWEKSTTKRDSLINFPPETNLPPFGDRGCITNINRFFDRLPLFRELYQYLKLRKNCSLVGDSEIGKSSILWKLCQEGHQYLNLPKKAFIYFNLQYCVNSDDFWREFHKKLKTGLNLSASGFEIRDKLAGKRYFLCLDEMEVLAGFSDDKLHPILNLLRALSGGGFQSPLTLITASRQPLCQLFPDSPPKPSPLANLFDKIEVKPFTEQDVKAFINYRLKETKIRFSEQQIEQLIETSKCHPAKLQEQAHELYQSLNKE